jgi:hypothetical protein
VQQPHSTALWLRLVHDAQVRALLSHGSVEMQASTALDMVLQQLLPAWHDHVRQEAVCRAQDKLPGAWRVAGVGCCAASYCCTAIADAIHCCTAIANAVSVSAGVDACLSSWDGACSRPVQCRNQRTALGCLVLHVCKAACV